MKNKKPPLSELKSMTIEELNFILSNLSSSDVNYRKTIADLIESKLEERKKETTERIRQLNEKLQDKVHYEFDVLKLESNHLIIAGSECCINCGHSIELNFKGMFHYAGNISSFVIEPEQPFLRLATPNEQKKFDQDFDLIQFKQTFILNDEDEKEILISSDEFWWKNV